MEAGGVHHAETDEEDILFESEPVKDGSKYYPAVIIRRTRRQEKNSDCGRRIGIESTKDTGG